MERIVLSSESDVDAAEERVRNGLGTYVQVAYEYGPHGLEPMVELLRMLLDRVQREFIVDCRAYEPHPHVDSRYLRSCSIRPKGPPSSGVREPRVSPTDPLSGFMTYDLWQV